MVLWATGVPNCYLLLQKYMTIAGHALQVNSAFVVNLHYAFQSSDKLYLIMDLMNGRRGACGEGGGGACQGCR